MLDLLGVIRMVVILGKKSINKLVAGRKRWSSTDDKVGGRYSGFLSANTAMSFQVQNLPLTLPGLIISSRTVRPCIKVVASL